MRAEPSLFGRMAALSEPLRARILLALERHELTVGELCAVFQLPQSTMSRHLKALVDEVWLTSRSEGPSRRYSLASHQLDAEARGLWSLVRDEVHALPAADQDAERIRSVLAERRSKSQAFFSTAAGEWDRLRGEFVGRRLDVLSLLGLLDPGWRVGDLGCGTGQVAAALAPFVGSVLAIDDSPEMLHAARERVGALPNVELRQGDLEHLPVEDSALDAAVLFLVLHHLGDPPAALQEVRRVLRPLGRLLVVDLTPHDREEYRQGMGHLWLGFGEDSIRSWFEAAQLEEPRYVRLPADPETKAPILFAASGRVPEGCGPKDEQKHETHETGVKT